jgi:uncharacterized protein (TIGR03067 family)
MKIQNSVVAACVLLVPVARAVEPEKPKNDMAALQGTWSMVSGTQDGKPLPEDVIKRVKVVVSGDKMTQIMDDRKHEHTYKLNPDKSPKEIDVDLGDGKVGKGIYELKGDTLKVAHGSKPDSPRPKDFTSQEGSGVMVAEFKRAKDIGVSDNPGEKKRTFKTIGRNKSLPISSRLPALGHSWREASSEKEHKSRPARPQMVARFYGLPA